MMSFNVAETLSLTYVIVSSLGLYTHRFSRSQHSSLDLFNGPENRFTTRQKEKERHHEGAAKSQPVSFVQDIYRS